MSLQKTELEIEPFELKTASGDSIKTFSNAGFTIEASISKENDRIESVKFVITLSPDKNDKFFSLGDL